jgi:hypothetical protein
MAFPKILAQPKRRVVETTGTHVVVGITPPAFMALPEQQLALTTDQYKRYLEWMTGSVLIQEALPELKASEREILLSGVGDDDFHKITGSDDE